MRAIGHQIANVRWIVSERSAVPTFIDPVYVPVDGNEDA
jgi:hypothetical protein